jgi:hypothetical protein
LFVPLFRVQVLHVLRQHKTTYRLWTIKLLMCQYPRMNLLQNCIILLYILYQRYENNSLFKASVELTTSLLGCMQSVPITTKIVSSNPTHGNVVLDTTLCHKICQWLATSLWFSPVTPDSSTNKTGHHEITEILLKVALNTINLNLIRTRIKKNFRV